MRPLAVQGILVPECHPQLSDILRSRLGEDFARLFAEPVFDQERGTVDWYTQLEGAPQPLSALDAETKTRILGRLYSMAGTVLDCARGLRPGESGESGKNAAQPSGSSAGRGLAGEILEAALRYPGEDSLYVIGGQPVVIRWGCGPATPGVEAEDLSRPRALPARPAPPAPPVTTAAPVTPSPAPAGEDIPVFTAAPAAPRSGCLPWLLALLLLLLLLGLLGAFLLGKVPALASTLAGWGLPVPVMDIRAADDEKNREAGLLAEIERLRQDVIRRKALCGTSTAPAETKAETRAEPKQGLSVPPEASKTGDLSFLKGEWFCDAGLADSEGKPVVVRYEFDARGKGEISIQGSAGICLGKAAGSLHKDGFLLIETDPAIPCPAGDSFRGQTIECRGTGAQTRCRGSNRDSETVWEAVFTKQ